MKMPKPSEADRENFRSLVPNAAGVEVKPMFGNLGAFDNGNMFAGLFGACGGVKLGADEQAALAALGAAPFGPAERPMGGYLTLPPTLTSEQAARWVDRARAHVATPAPKRRK
ncbi:MAG TPA: TfoX/Sxy family protein [Aldersonia sp.]